jgi:PAS domain S-box-containing protein
MRIDPFGAKSSHAGVAGTELSVADVTITPQLWVRAPRSSNIDAETAAMRRLGDTMATEPSKTFQVCVDLALELCDADTCGISLRERTEKGEDIFRWIAMAGQLKHHLHGTTPRYFSPCGITVDGDAPLLMKRPELVYKYLDVGPAFHDVLLIPLTEKGGELEGTIWVVAHNPERKFDGEDARVMQRIAVFIATALHLAKLAQEAKAQATRQELLFRQLIMEQRLSEAALREKEADLRLVLDSATDAVWCIDTAGVTTMCNAVFLRMLGIEREEHAIGKKLHEIIHHSRADGSYYPEQECPICRTAQGAGAAHIDNEVFFRLDGTSFPVEYRVGPIYRDGQLQGAVCTFVDISERKHAQEQQSLLLRELNHRVKNLFAVTSSMIALSVRSADTPKELARNICGRLDALARAHELVLPRPGSQSDAQDESTSLECLLHTILSPYVGSQEERNPLVMHGPPVVIGAHAVTSLALVLHELATNAAKYGAFSVPEGSVHVRWACPDDTLVMRWEERGGPTLAAMAPMAEGFGTVLCNHSVHGQFGGTFSRSWTPSGLVVDLSIPGERLRV